jgi:predicted dehydrogenase
VTDPLRIGVLGAAAITPDAITKPAAKNPDVVVAAVAARDPERAKAFADKHGIAQTHATYDDLLADEAIDVIYNPLPNGLHGRWTVAALEAGKHVLCEKPFTANAEEAASVAQIADASPLVVMEAFHYRYHPVARWMSEFMSSGELGQIEHIEMSFCAPLAKRGDIRYRLDLAGGATMDMGCYPINLLRLLIEAEPTVTSAQAKLSSAGVDRAMEMAFSLPNGGTAAISCSMFSSKLLSSSAKITGSNGQLKVFNPFGPHYYHRIKATTGEGSRIVKLSRRPTYDYQLDAFVAAVRDKVPFSTSPDDAVLNMTVIDAVYQAAGLPRRQPST